MSEPTKSDCGERSIEPSEPEASSRVSRRDVLFGAAGIGATAAVATSVALPKTARADDYSSDAGDVAYDGFRRADVAFVKRLRSAKVQRHETLNLEDQRDNDDESRYEDELFISSFHKCLPQNEFGEVRPRAYRKLRRACRRGDPKRFDRIPLSSVADRTLANPQGAFRFEPWGLDSHATRMPPAPAFRSPTIAAEMGEVYWQAFTRDVPFNRYGSDGLVDAAVQDVNRFSKTVGPKMGGKVTPATLFRGETRGDLIGPYISQFLWLDVPWGPSRIVQRYEVPVAGEEYMIDQAEWLRIQRGANPSSPLNFEPTFRYIYNNRALGEYVHRDVLFQAYFNAALILLSFGNEAIDPANPYTKTGANQGGFTSLGPPFILDLVTRAGNLGLSGAWFHKWRIHRRLRPEVFGGRAHFNVTGQRSYEICDEFFASRALELAFETNGTGFLPMAFPEGSPTHPAYPAGHATVAGSCCTVLKALFNEDFVLPRPVVSNDDGTVLNAYNGSLRAGDEINKLAANVSIGRDAAGVHYRSDGIDGLVVGEQQALTLLREASTLLNEDFDGFTLSLFDGSRVRITDGQIIDEH
ncbi:MAG: vanadium-dependent haloperoxidase [Myxococcota bacterium]